MDSKKLQQIVQKIRRLPKSISFRLHMKRYGYPPPVYNCVWEKNSPIRKKALLSYITTPFRLPANDPQTIQFSNIGIARSIIRVLNNLGYAVDVIEYSDTAFRPSRQHQLFIGHLGNNFQAIADHLPSGVPKLYFATTPHWQVSNNAEEERFHQLEVRRGVNLSRDRRIEFSEDQAYQAANGIICLGSPAIRDTFSKFPIVRTLNNGAYHDARYELAPKDFERGRNHFLFFSGPGNVHKGLDLLLEAFTHLDAHLYICQNIDPEFETVYHRELTEFPNIHLVGHIHMRTPQFYNLIDQCNFVILPSCGEGQPGSVVECMHQGLIPIVSRENHIDTEHYGITLTESSVSVIIATVQDLSQRPTLQLAQMSQETRQAAVSKFSEAAFLHNMTVILQELTGDNLNL